jgi:DNA-binding beta-propeller fold protein YncE
MYFQKLLIGLLCLPLFTQGQLTSTPAQIETKAQNTAKLRAMIEATPKLPLEQIDLVIKLPEGQEMGMISWIARDPKAGVTWLLQRGDKADPVIAVDKEGHVLHSFGKGLYKIPHALRLDPEGNVWTVDAGSSTIIKFSPKGETLLQIDVGVQPESAASAFRGTTDIAFAPKGRIFISDGYANARILEYIADGKTVREWGSAGAGPGQFHLPHSIVADENNILYVADRENGRIEKFNLDGKFLGEFPNLGRTYSLKLGANGTLWAGMQPLNEPTGSPGWVVKLDRKTGKILGYVPVTEKGGLHSVEDAGEGRPMTVVGNRIVWFKSHSK